MSTGSGKDFSLDIDRELRDQVDAYIRENKSYLLKLTTDICSIPSPTGYEERKADFVLEKLREMGQEDAWIDEKGSVLCHIESKKDRDISLYTAHIDTVFDGVDEICPTHRDDRIYAPSIWDNSVNVAGLIFCIKMFRDLNIEPTNDILLAFTVGEEGLGNLKGMRNVMDHWKDKVTQVVALDTGYEGVLNRGIGSRRYSIEVHAEGGHSWSAFGKSNAIAYAARVLNALYEIQLPPEPKTTYNVGLIEGGRGVNVIAQDAKFLMDFRSLEEESLAAIEKKFFALLEDSKEDGIEVEITLLGERPCSRDVDLSSMMRPIESIRQYLGLETDMRSGSTDANIPLSLGIPAVTFGVCNGAKAHTLEEYIEVDSLETGMRHLAYFMIIAKS